MKKSDVVVFAVVCVLAVAFALLLVYAPQLGGPITDVNKEFSETDDTTCDGCGFTWLLPVLVITCVVGIVGLMMAAVRSKK